MGKPISQSLKQEILGRVRERKTVEEIATDLLLPTTTVQRIIRENLSCSERSDYYGLVKCSQEDVELRKAIALAWKVDNPEDSLGLEQFSTEFIQTVLTPLVSEEAIRLFKVLAPLGYEAAMELTTLDLQRLKYFDLKDLLETNERLVQKKGDPCLA